MTGRKAWLAAGLLGLGLGLGGCMDREREPVGEPLAERPVINDERMVGTGGVEPDLGVGNEVNESDALVDEGQAGVGGSGVDLGLENEPNEKDAFVDEGQPGIGGSGADVGVQNEPNEKDAFVDEGAAAIGGSGQLGEGVDNPAIWSGKDTFKVSGKLTEQNGNDLTVSRQNLPPVQLEAHNKTKVTLNGKSISSGELDQLPINSNVDAQFQINGDEIIATELKVQGGR